MCRWTSSCWVLWEIWWWDMRIKRWWELCIKRMCWCVTLLWISIKIIGSTVVLLHCGCLSLNPFIEFSIRNNSSSSDVLNIQASISISPKFESKSKTTSHCHLLLHDCTNVAVWHLLKLMLLQNTILKQPSTSPIQSFKSQKPKRNSNAYGYHRFNVVSTSQSARMPRFLACPVIYESKIGPKTSQE